MLKDEMPRQGEFLFRWRSYLPLILLPLILIELSDPLSHIEYSNTSPTAWGLLSLVVVLIGVTIRVIATGYAPKGTSGRNTKEQVAERLNTAGIYSTCRNPLYLGNLVILCGIILMIGSWRLLLIVILAFVLYYERIIYTEEQFLENKFGDAYRDWAAKTPFLIPAVSKWEKPDRPFSWKRVLKKELYGTMSAATAMFVINIANNYFLVKHLKVDRMWLIIFITTLITFVVVRYLKKHTNTFQGV